MSDTVKGVITTTHRGLISDLHKRAVADIWASLTGKISLELVSNIKVLNAVKANASFSNFDASKEMHAFHYCTFKVPTNFGDIGAVFVENEYHTKIFIMSIVLDNGVTFPCDSWVLSKYDNPAPRIFFANKSNYLPSETPEGLKEFRKSELESLRGNSEGERKSFDRIYDYDRYNDLGDRPVLGGEQHPYPRRCRTGRAVSDGHESRILAEGQEYFYLPIDEDFSEIKTDDSALRMLMNLLQSRKAANSTDKKEGLPDKKEGLPLLGGTFSWLNDAEFCRQMLAGVNPCSIQLVTAWPLKSKSGIESAITKEQVENKIGGFMSLETAVENKSLFMLDYHDLLLPYVNKTREIPGTTLYCSRTLLFLNRDDGTLMPIAIELTRPELTRPELTHPELTRPELTRPEFGTKPEWRHVYQPSAHATDDWLWKLAKAHVLAHDSGYHQLVSHWLRTHCVSEPYIISAHRNLSQMHPIYRLLFPHFQFTMQINALARQGLINADGVIESSFSTAKYSMELSSDAYKLWRFDQEALPDDLIRRGMATEDKEQPHGLKLTIEDYPYANDGLLLWDAIEQWVTSYVNHYYRVNANENPVEKDAELQAWWTEIRDVGHQDLKGETWWPKLEDNVDLIKIVSTIIWVVSGHHAAVNFGKYEFAGYFPDRPTIARTNMPNEDHKKNTEEWNSFLKRPEDALLQCFPSKPQAMKVMATLTVLSDHSPDEIYIGRKTEPAWDVVPEIKTAFKTFTEALKKMEETIDERNKNPKLKNRSGAGIVPYQLLKPCSDKAGVTCREGVPNSISI